eukprot:19331-Heterococcus_DN1.PRE.1
MNIASTAISQACQKLHVVLQQHCNADCTHSKYSRAICCYCLYSRILLAAEAAAAVLGINLPRQPSLPHSYTQPSPIDNTSVCCAPAPLYEGSCPACWPGQCCCAVQRLACKAADRFNINKSWEHVQAKHVGTGHADFSKHEWATNQHRDSIASHLGHSDIINFFAVAQNQSQGRVRYELMHYAVHDHQQCLCEAVAYTAPG